MKNNSKVNISSNELITEKNDLCLSKYGLIKKIGILDNISEENQELLSLIFMYMSDFMIVINKKMQIVYSNFEQEDQYATNYLESFCPAFCSNIPQDCYACILKSIFETKKGINFEKYVPQINKYYEITGFPVIQKNKVQFAVYISRDISRRRIAENTLRESEQRLKSFFDNLCIGFYRVKPEGDLIMANNSFLNILGFDTIAEYNIFQTQDSSYSNKIYKELFIKTTNSENKIKGYESMCKKKNGEKIHVRENAIAVKDNEGKILYYEGTIEDITNIKIAEHRLVNEKWTAETELKRKTIFFAKFTKEIKEPIEKIITVSELKAGTQLSVAKCIDYAKIINSSGKSLLEFIENINNLPDINPVLNSVPQKLRFQVNKLISEVYEKFADASISNENLYIIAHKNLKDDQAYLFSDKSFIKKIFSNLIDSVLSVVNYGNIDFGYSLEKEYYNFYVSCSVPSRESEKLPQKYSESIENINVIVAKGLTEIMGGVFKSEIENNNKMIHNFWIPSGIAIF